ncbi:Clavaminate synthase-like protein [Peniophora sp. CONT]|nr:Clavaminate synthase-like protein [Peniophora sp. CONT]
MNGDELKDFCRVLLHDGEDDAESGEACIRDRLHTAAATISEGTAASSAVAAVVADLDVLRNEARAEMQSAARAGEGDPYSWRRLYTDASLLKALSALMGGEDVAENVVLENIAVLDHALVVAGAAGDGRYELIINAISTLQRWCTPPSPPTTAVEDGSDVSEIQTRNVALASSMRSVPCLDPPPSLGRFAREYAYSPFALRGYARDWPALSERPWASASYLRSVAGPGRVVPVEVGHDYRADDWTQAMIPWDDFIRRFEAGEALYLAQHDLFFQFPALQQDIIIPDYVYSAPAPPHDFPAYTPPANAEQLVTNAWFGPGGTVSPAHTDPFFNFFVQVVGRKTLWLAPPAATPYMYAYPPPSASGGVDVAHNPAANTTAPSMSNTTRVDVFAARGDEEEGEFADFWKHAVPLAMHVTLGPGDALLLPPGWWHATRSEETSFSVSMWY